jgi:hypothetical protein
MRLILAFIGLQLATTPPPAASDPGLHWAFVTIYVTVPAERTTRRIKVVTPVFPLCGAGELPSVVFAATDSSLRAAIRRVTQAEFAITHRSVEVRTSRDSAEAARGRGLHDRRFALVVPTRTAPARCCCTRPP